MFFGNIEVPQQGFLLPKALDIHVIEQTSHICCTLIFPVLVLVFSPYLSGVTYA